MIARQRPVADVTWVGAAGSRPRACALTMSLWAVSRTMRVCLTTGSGYGVVLVASLLFCGCSGAQFDGQLNDISLLSTAYVYTFIGVNFSLTYQCPCNVM